MIDGDSHPGANDQAEQEPEHESAQPSGQDSAQDSGQASGRDDGEFLSRVNLIEGQPLEARAAAYSQLHEELRGVLEGGDRSPGA